MKNKWIVIAGVLGLVATRFVGQHYFYDPLTAFFHMADYKTHELPAIHSGRFAFFLSLRYALNMFWSVLMVYFWFGKKDLVRLTLQIMGAAYLVLLPQVVFLSSWATPDQYAWLFYARRLLIHPLLILILLPAYMYYVYEQKQQKND